MPLLKRFPVAAVVVTAIALAACGDDSGDAADPISTTTTPSTTEAPSSTEAAEPDPAADGDGYDFSALSPIVQEFVDEHELNGAGLIVVDADDGVVHQDYWGEFDADRISLVASSSKMVTAGVLMYLHDQGVLDIDAPVADVVPWGEANPEITPAQLVSNSSGLVGLGPDVGYAPYLCQFSPIGSLQECAETIFTTPGDDDDVIAPDTQFRYGGGQWQVAGAVAEVASGKPWAQLIDQIYTEPCDLDALAFNNPFIQLGAAGFVYPTAFNGDPGTLQDTDNPNLEAGSYVTTGDYAKLLLMHLRGGMCEEIRVLSAEAVDRLHRDRVAEAYDGEAAVDNPGYGMGWWVDRETGRITDGGAFGSVPWLDLEDGYGAYLVIEADSRTGGQLAEQLFEPVEAAIKGG